MALIVNKINQFDKDIAATREAMNTFKSSLEPRLKRLEKEIQRLAEKLDELTNTVEACFAEAGDSNSTIELESLSLSSPDSPGSDVVSEFTYDADGSLLVSADRKEELEARGYTVIGTTTKDSRTLLKMRQQ